jgi:hypothetical protein
MWAGARAHDRALWPSAEPQPRDRHRRRAGADSLVAGAGAGSRRLPVVGAGRWRNLLPGDPCSARLRGRPRERGQRCRGARRRVLSGGLLAQRAARQPRRLSRGRPYVQSQLRGALLRQRPGGRTAARDRNGSERAHLSPAPPPASRGDPRRGLRLLRFQSLRRGRLPRSRRGAADGHRRLIGRRGTRHGASTKVPARD